MTTIVPGEFRVLRWEVRDFVGDYQCMDYGNPNHARLVQLRQEYKLDSVIEGSRTEFDAFLALKRWVRSRWDHGYSHSFKTVKDALDILHEVEKGEQFCCGHYSKVFVESATALGWVSRGVGISIANCEHPRDYHVGNVGHSIAEIWSNEYERWVVMDPDINIHYTRDGIPLNALEVRDAWLDGYADKVEVVQDKPEFVIPAGRNVQVLRETAGYWPDVDEETIRMTCETFTRNQVMDYYARVHIGKWEWVDPKCLPTFAAHFQPKAEAVWTSNLADMYWSVNQVRIATRPSWDESGARLGIALQHCTPFFDHYERRVDGGEWERCQPTFDWPMHEGGNRLECRAVNVKSRPGISSRVDVAYARPPR